MRGANVCPRGTKRVGRKCVRNTTQLAKSEKKLIRGYIQFMAGFEESSLYLDYREVEDFSDEDYDKAINLLNKISR